jgi:hypothetical protein
MKCAACQVMVKDWNGDDPTCSFRGGSFNSEGWNCATSDLIRELVYEGQNPMPAGVDYQYCDDMKYTTVNVSHLDIDGAMALWVAWYKSRGRTDAMWLLYSDQSPRAPTAEECVRIVEAYKGQQT